MGSAGLEVLRRGYFGLKEGEFIKIQTWWKFFILLLSDFSRLSNPICGELKNPPPWFDMELVAVATLKAEALLFRSEVWKLSNSWMRSCL